MFQICKNEFKPRKKNYCYNLTLKNKCFKVKSITVKTCKCQKTTSKSQGTNYCIS